MKIVHCAYFKTLRLRGCFWAGMAYKLNNGLTRLGHQTVCYNDREAARALALFGTKTPWSVRKTNDNFYHYCLDFRPDAIILGHADIITAETLLKIRDKVPGVKILQWNVDCINPYTDWGEHNIGNIKSKLDAVDFSLITTADRKLLRQFDPIRHNVGFIPNPVDKGIEDGQTFANPAPMYDLLFAASPVKLREFGGKMAYGREIAEFLQRRAPENRFLFPRISSPMLNGTVYFDTLKQAAGVLNLSLSNHDYLYSSDRMAHAMGNGCLTYIDRHTGFGGLFGEDEAGFFSSAEELIEQIERFRKFPAERAKTAERGWRHYHALFNETAIAGYVAALLGGNFNAADYPFPTLLQAETGAAETGAAETGA